MPVALPSRFITRRLEVLSCLLLLLGGVAACRHDPSPTPVTPTPVNSPPTTGSIAVTPGAAGMVGFTTFAFSATGVTDPDGDPISYSWDFGDGSATASGASAPRTYAGTGTFTVTLRASDGHNAAIVAAQRTITVRTLTSRWTGHLTCPACAVTAVDMTLTLSQTGATVTGGCTVTSPGFSGTLTGFFGSGHDIVNMLGNCGGGSIDAILNATTDVLNMIWKSDYTGNLTRG